MYAIDAEGPRVEVTSPDRAPEMVCDALVGKPRALLLAIAGLTGISACAAYVIPHLLLPEMLDHELARNKRLADPIDESCYELDAATGLIVRFLERKTEIAYAPQLDD